MKVIFLMISLFLCSFSLNAADWIYSFDQGKAVSFSKNKLMLVDFGASRCELCKTMDKKVWNKESVRRLQDNYISVKINIDINKNLAIKYGIKEIPATLLVDGLGNVVYQSSGYKGQLEIENLLQSFDGDVKHLNQSIGHYHDNEKDAMRNLMLAKGYQKYISTSKNKVKFGFITNSLIYLRKAKKLARKSGNKDLEHSIELTKIYNGILLDKTEKAIEDVYKMLEKEKLSNRNLALAYFTIIKGLEMIGEGREGEIYFEKLKNLPKSRTVAYLKKLAASTKM